MAEEHNMFLLLYSFGKQTQLLTDLNRLFVKPKKGRVEIFCSLDGKEYTPQLAQTYSQLLGAEVTNMYAKPLNPKRNMYNKIDLSKVETDIEIPSKPYITWQFDGISQGPNSECRQWTDEEKQAIRDKFSDYEIVSIEGMHNYPDGLDRAVKLINGAEFHIGVDSGMGHVAMALGKYIHIYYTSDGRRQTASRKHMFGFGTKWQNGKYIGANEI